MKRFVLGAALGVALGVSATGTLAARHEKPSGYAADGSIDLSGIYQPMRHPFKIGRYELIGITIDNADDFHSYAREKRHGRSAPIMLFFDDLSVERAGGRLREYELVVLPRSYRVDNESIAFDGRHPKLGRVTFLGKLDGASVKAAEVQDSPESDGSVLKGDLTVGGKLYHDVEFFWFNGDP